MAASKEEIINLALANLGDNDAVESINQLSSPAKRGKRWYDTSRKQALEAFNWNFASKRLTLALHGEAAPEEDWCFRYSYPSDAIIIRRIINPLGDKAPAIPFTVEMDSAGTTKTILTNMEQAKVAYTFDLQTTTFFSPHFDVVLSYLLAYHIALGSAKKKALRDEMWGSYVYFLSQAQPHNANEAVADAPREASWIEGRA